MSDSFAYLSLHKNSFYFLQLELKKRKEREKREKRKRKEREKKEKRERKDREKREKRKRKEREKRERTLTIATGYPGVQTFPPPSPPQPFISEREVGVGKARKKDEGRVN